MNTPDYTELTKQGVTTAVRVSLKAPAFLGLNGLKIAPVVAGKLEYQVTPLRGDVESPI